MSSLWGLATTTKVERIDDEPHHGFLTQETYADVGYRTGDIWESDGAVTEYQADERRKRSLMPIEYANKTAKDFDWTKYAGQDVTAQKKIVNSFILRFNDFAREGRGLFISSKTRGSGKTLLACCTASEILKKHDKTVKFISVPNYIELIKEKDDSSRETREAIMDAGLLILDDAGAQVENREWITTALFRLIDKRYSNRLPTIYTSNLRMEDLKTDSRIADRIYARSVPVIMPEVPVRKRLADEKTNEFLKGLLGGEEIREEER